jgi:hypothetical protein
VTFSRKWTLVNIGASVMGHVIFVLVAYFEFVSLRPAMPSVPSGVRRETTGGDFTKFIPLYFTICLPSAILGILLTLLFLYVDCCSRPCRACCILTPLEIGVLVLDDSLVEYVKVRDSEGKKEIITKAEWKERKKSDYTFSPDPLEDSSDSPVSKSMSLHTGINEDESVL